MNSGEKARVEEKVNQAAFIFIVGLGGALGAISRFLVSKLLPPFLFLSFPFPIIFINIIGCFAMGLITQLFEAYITGSPALRTFLTVGFLGGFTTFSAFSLEFALLMEKKLIMQAMLYAVLSVLLSILAFYVGMKVVKLFIYG